MNTYMVVAKFKPKTDMNAVQAVVQEERAQVEVLRKEGRLGAIYISMARGTVFLEVFAPDETGAEATVKTLPLSEWWSLEIYPTPEPTLPRDPSS